MRELEEGDRVVVIGETFRDQVGLTGTITSIIPVSKYTNETTALNVRIEYDTGQDGHPYLAHAKRISGTSKTANVYNKRDLKPVEIMPAPEMELDEIERAQEVYHGLQDR